MASEKRLTARQYAQAVAMDEEVRICLAVREALKRMMIHVLPLGTDEEATMRWINEQYPAPVALALESLLAPPPAAGGE